MPNQHWRICASHSLPVYVSKRSNASFAPGGEVKPHDGFARGSTKANSVRQSRAHNQKRGCVCVCVCVVDPSKQPNLVPRLSHPALATFSARRRHSCMHDLD